MTDKELIENFVIILKEKMGIDDDKIPLSEELYDLDDLNGPHDDENFEEFLSVNLSPQDMLEIMMLVDPVRAEKIINDCCVSLSEDVDIYSELLLHLEIDCGVGIDHKPFSNDMLFDSFFVDINTNTFKHNKDKIKSTFYDYLLEELGFHYDFWDAKSFRKSLSYWLENNVNSKFLSEHKKDKLQKETVKDEKFKDEKLEKLNELTKNLEELKKELEKYTYTKN